MSDLILQRLERVGQQYDLDDLATRVADLHAWLGEDLCRLEAHLSDMITNPPSDSGWAAAEHLLAQPGKRVRPICVMLAARLGGRDFDAPLREVAVCAELIHNATLLHDDVIDHSFERRGAPTSRMIFGNAISVLGGDHLLMSALIRIEPFDPRILRKMMVVIRDMVAAEVLQLELKNSFKADRAAYLSVVHGKTAALFRWAMEAGAIMADLSEAQVEALGAAGQALGMTFQLTDDLLDLEGEREETGKEAFIDLAEGKLTWPTILASERDAGVEHRLRQAAAGESIDFHQLLRDFNDLGVLEDTRVEAERYAGVARLALQTLPDHPARSALMTVVEAARRRSR